jgi:hypothetical protein
MERYRQQVDEQRAKVPKKRSLLMPKGSNDPDVLARREKQREANQKKRQKRRAK